MIVLIILGNTLCSLFFKRGYDKKYITYGGYNDQSKI